MFSIGDKIIYGGTGVCTITDIGVPDVPGACTECYMLKPHYMANSKIYAPVEGNPVKTRLLLTPEQAQTLIDSMPDIQPFPANKEKQELHKIYQDAVQSTDSFVLAKLLKTLYEKKQRLLEQRKAVPSVEKEYFDIAEHMLYGEIAVVLQMPIEEVEGYIANRLEHNYSGLHAAVS